jgi:ABC-type Fe3+/spermidine/putrescine transport system ATPase subunit
MRGAPATDIARKVEAALATVSLAGFGERFPNQLSGGQQQRVAIARVLVLEPRVLLLDEPFNALDAKLRGSMQVELRHLIKRLGITAIFVTHDQEEAMTLSDRIAVMRSGRIEQLAAPEEIYDRPASAYVADFIGASNVWAASTAGGMIRLPDGQCFASTLNGPAKVMVRPHNLQIARADVGSPWVGRLTSRRHVGALMEYEVALPDGSSLRAAALRGELPEEPGLGEEVSLTVRDPSACMAFPAS